VLHNWSTVGYICLFGCVWNQNINYSTYQVPKLLPTLVKRYKSNTLSRYIHIWIGIVFFFFQWLLNASDPSWKSFATIMMVAMLYYYLLRLLMEETHHAYYYGCTRWRAFTCKCVCLCSYIGSNNKNYGDDGNNNNVVRLLQSSRIIWNTRETEKCMRGR